jgi:hypothetical protein
MAEDSPISFSINRRNYGHWDFTNRDRGRLFRLRGGPGKWRAMDERAAPYPVTCFKEQSAAVAFICAELMHELLTVEGQEPYVMEAWNV